MRDRIARTRRIIELAHNEEMIKLLKEMIAEAEADIRKMEQGLMNIAEAKPATPE